MGSYATTTSLDTLMPEYDFTAPINSLASICINWAESKIKSELSRRYDVSAAPFLDNSNPELVSLSEQLAIGFMFKQMSRGAPESLERGDTMIAFAMNCIEDIATYKRDLANSDGTLVDSRSDRSITKSTSDSYHRTFNEDDPLNWDADPDKLEDIFDERD